MSKNQACNWDDRHRLWLDFVNSVATTFAAAASLPTGPSSPPLMSPRATVPAQPGCKVLICSPHPDDEALVGALPLRLRLESGAEVVNCAITLGSKKAERPRRLEELQASCAVLGFKVIVPDFPNGLEGVTDRCECGSRAEAWREKVRKLSAIFDAEQPELVLFPHAADFHEAHMGTHRLALEALRLHLQSKPRLVVCAETEYWRPMERPNLMLGVSPEVEAVLVMAVAEHGGEVRRNPYHIQHPARLIDNARRGAEVVGGAGGSMCSFQFAELYRISFMDGCVAVAPCEGGIVIDPTAELDLSRLRDGFLPKQ